MEDTEQPEEAISAGDQETGVPGLTVDPRAVGDRGHSAPRGHHHPADMLKIVRGMDTFVPS